MRLEYTRVQITKLFRRVPYPTCAAIAAACLAGTVMQAAAPTARTTGHVEGIVRLVAATAAAIPSGAYPSRRVSRPGTPGPEMKHVVVFVKDAPRADTLPTVRQEIVQKDEAFSPAVLAVTRGSTVEFPNSDPYFHNVFSLSRTASFDLGRYPRGDSRARTFTRAGLVKVYCHIHSHMSASIMVFDHPHFTVPADDGFFRIEDVPAGRFTLTAWHERIGESATPIVVEPGRATRAEFVLPVEDR
jgi:plastocyanin